MVHVFLGRVCERQRVGGCIPFLKKLMKEKREEVVKAFFLQEMGTF